MAVKSLSEILAEVAGKAKKETRIDLLHKNDSRALRMMLAIALNPSIKWDLPEGDPPYTPNELAHDQEGTLYNEIRRLYLFLKPNTLFEEYNPNVTPAQRELLFIQLLETVGSEDAKLLLAAKNKRLPVKVSKDTIEGAFNGLTTWDYARG